MNAKNLTTISIALLLQFAVSCHLPQCSAAAPNELRQAMAALDAELQSDPSRRDRWRDVLEIDRLEELVHQEDDVAIRDLKSILRRYSATEMIGSPLLADARNSVTKWTEAPNNEALAGEASDAVSRLRRSFTSSGRRYWDAILSFNELSGQVGAGAGHDKDKVAEILAGFAAEEAHGDRSRFVAVRRTLGRWINELEEPVTDSLAREARDAVVSYQPVESWRTEEARNKLKGTLRELEAFLATGADWKREGWANYLQLEDLHSEIDQPLDARLIVLDRIRGQFNSGVIGLQRPEFRGARDALRSYYELSRMVDASESQRAMARDRLQDAVNLLGDYVASGGKRKEGGWKRYLRWDALNDELASTDPDVRKLLEIGRKFNSGAPGLEKTPFRLAGRRLDKYIESLRLQRMAQPIDLYASQIEKLARALQKQSNEPTGVSASDMARSMEWLDSMGQAPDLMQRIRRQYSHTNLFASVSERVLTKPVENVVTDNSPVGQWYKDVYISGTACTRAQVRGQLVPCADRVILDILLTGTTDTSTVGRRRRVSVRATGTTCLSGCKRLYFEPEHGLSGQPATASAQTDQNIRGINVDSRLGRQLITRIATRKAYETLPEAESLANREARKRIREQMDDEAQKVITKANVQLRERIEMPLRKERLYPEFIHVSSTSERVEMQARLTPGNHMGAPGKPPVWDQSDDVAICLHESVVNNALAPYFGGLRIDNENIVKLLEENDLEVPAELQPGGDAADEQWSVTFDLWQPVSLAIKKNRINFSILGVRFTGDNQEINERIRIGATYRVEWKANQLPELFREGDVEIEFIDSPGQLSAKQLTYKTFLNRKVGSLFSDHIDASELKLKNDKLSEALEAITLRRVWMDKGWFSAGYDVDVEALPLEL